MKKTVITKAGDKFLINGSLTYSEIPDSNPETNGLLMNARFIQGVFDDKNGRDKYARFGSQRFDPEENTDSLIRALPIWYAYGLRAFTVGFQGGGPCFTTDNNTIDNNPFGESGTSIDPAYLDRMGRIITAADELGMVVIVSLFYGSQARRIINDTDVRQAVKVACNWLAENEFKNVIIEVANEFDLSVFNCHPVLNSPEGIRGLMDLARRESGGMLVGCSGSGGHFNELVVKASDVILIHGNSQTRQGLYNLIMKCKEANPGTPIVCNEDSQAVSMLPVAVRCGVSWGYYNNMTKQEPPARWEIQDGEDMFFAARMAMSLGISVPKIPDSEQYVIMGLEPYETYGGKRWIRLASLYPEKIDYVEFFRNGEFITCVYDDPFSVGFVVNWLQRGIDNISGKTKWEAVVHLTDGGKFTVSKEIIEE